MMRDKPTPPIKERLYANHPERNRPLPPPTPPGMPPNLPVPPKPKAKPKAKVTPTRKPSPTPTSSPAVTITTPQTHTTPSAPKAKTPKTKSDPAPVLSGRQHGYDWGDGKGATHTITLKDHKGNVKLKALQPYNLGSNSQYGSPGDVKKSVSAAEDEKYGQPIITQQGAITDSQKRQNVDIPGWYDQYRQALAAARAATSTEYTGVANASAAASQPLGPSATDAQKADAVRAGNQNGFADMLRGQGAAQATNYDNLGANSSLAQIGSTQAEAANRQKLTLDLGQLQKEKGDYGNTVLNDYRGKQMTYDTSMAAAQAAAAASGATLDENKREFDAKDATNNRRITSSDNQEAAKLTASLKIADAKAKTGKPKTAADKLNAAKLAYFKKHGYFPATGPPTSASTTVSPAAARAAGNAWNGAIDFIRHNPETNDTNSIQNDAHAPYDIASAAHYWATHSGKITSVMAERLEALGIPATAFEGHIKG